MGQVVSTGSRAVWSPCASGQLPAYQVSGSNGYERCIGKATSSKCPSKSGGENRYGECRTCTDTQMSL